MPSVDYSDLVDVDKLVADTEVVDTEAADMRAVDIEADTEVGTAGTAVVVVQRDLLIRVHP